MEIKKKEIDNSEEMENGIIPLPEIAKDFLLILEFLILFFFLFIAYLGKWRRRIIRRDTMTEDFEKLMDKANQLKED